MVATATSIIRLDAHAISACLGLGHPSPSAAIQFLNGPPHRYDRLDERYAQSVTPLTRTQHTASGSRLSRRRHLFRQPSSKSSLNLKTSYLLTRRTRFLDTMASPATLHLSYVARLQSFIGHWDDNLTTGRQLAAIGHVCDRPPLESLEEGSRCIACNKFIPKETSIRVLEGPIQRSQNYAESSFSFHRPRCLRLQSRIPYESVSADLDGTGFDDIRSKWERKAKPRQTPRPEEHQTSSLFLLPTELRLEIYSYLLPSLDPTTGIVPLYRDSIRMVTKGGFEKPGRRDKTRSNILLTCKAVHAEALDILFVNTTYDFTSSKNMYLFLRQIGRVGRQLLKSVDIICGQKREDAISFALLASCENLRSITIRLPRPRILFPVMPLWHTDAMACLLHISGLECVNFGACSTPLHMKDGSHDAEVIRRQLTRPRGKPWDLREVEGVLDV